MNQGSKGSPSTTTESGLRGMLWNGCPSFSGEAPVNRQEAGMSPNGTDSSSNYVVSVDIIDQLVDNIPSGAINVLPDDKQTLPDKDETWPETAIEPRRFAPNELPRIATESATAN